MEVFFPFHVVISVQVASKKMFITAVRTCMNCDENKSPWFS